MSFPTKKFDKVHIEITNICNLQCSFCPEVLRKKGIMPVSLFESALIQVAPHARQVCLHLMGEPLSHPQFDEIVELCMRYGVQIYLVSNGILVKRRWDSLLKPAFRQINFSLHSFSDNYPDKDPTEYLDAIFDYTLEANRVRPEMYFNYRLWNLESSDPESPRKSASNQRIIREIEKRFDCVIPPEIQVSRKKSFDIRHPVYLHFDSRFDWPSMALPTLGEFGTCYGLKQHVGILVDGTVVPCCLDKEGIIPLGNLQSQSFVEILNAPRARELRLGFDRRELKEELCQKCSFIRRFARPSDYRVKSASAEATASAF